MASLYAELHIKNPLFTKIFYMLSWFLLRKKIKVQKSCRVQGGAIGFSPPPLPSYEVEGVKILLPHPVV